MHEAAHCTIEPFTDISHIVKHYVSQDCHNSLLALLLYSCH